VADEITPELFAHLVELAALELTPEEGEYLRKELNSQLKAIHELEKIPVPDDVPPAAHGVAFPPAIRPTLRDDRERPSGQSPGDVPRPAAEAEKILQQAPETDEGYFVVPEIPHTELS